jgi:hypothetical protein
MKKATELPAYRDVKDFTPPSGIVTASLDTNSNLMATANSSATRSEIFIEGTEPAVAGSGGLGPGTVQNKGDQPSGISKILSEILHGGKSHAEPAPAGSPASAGATPGDLGDGSSVDPAAKPKGKGVLGKFLSVFKGKSQTPPLPNNPPKKPDAQ